MICPNCKQKLEKFDNSYKCSDKHSFDIYGIGDGKYELCVTFLGEHGEYKISNYKLNVVINEDFNKNSLKYNICYEYYIEKKLAVNLSMKYHYSEAGIRKILKMSRLK